MVFEKDSDSVKVEKLANIRISDLDQYFLDHEGRLTRTSDINIKNYSIPPPPQMATIRGHFVRASNSIGAVSRLSALLNTTIASESDDEYIQHFANHREVEAYCMRINSFDLVQFEPLWKKIKLLTMTYLVVQERRKRRKMKRRKMKRKRL